MDQGNGGSFYRRNDGTEAMSDPRDYLGLAQTYLGVKTASTPGVDAPEGMVDKIGDAGFGTRFGPMASVDGMVIHHTGGGKSVDEVVNTFKHTNFPAHFVIDRDGVTYQTLPDGFRGQHTLKSYGTAGTGMSNENMEGVEIIANNDADVLPAQQEAAMKLVAMRAKKFGYNPVTSVYGHGEVNPGHKQATEGKTVVNRIRAAGAATPGEGRTVGEGAIVSGPNGEMLSNIEGKWVDLKTHKPYEVPGS
jgi:hypothetical protein